MQEIIIGAFQNSFVEQKIVIFGFYHENLCIFRIILSDSLRRMELIRLVLSKVQKSSINF